MDSVVRSLSTAFSAVFFWTVMPEPVSAAGFPTTVAADAFFHTIVQVGQGAEYPSCGIQTNIANNALGMDDTSKATFNKKLMTSAPQAAKTIVKAIKAGKSQIFIGPDAQFMQALKRVWPDAALWASGILFKDVG